MTIRAAIGLGSNLGDRARHIAYATSALSDLGKLVRVSSLYETAPVGGPDQSNYLNAVVLIDTELPPNRLLAECLRIERDRGRERRERWGPRTLDLDVLLYGTQTIELADLRVPHPRIAERRFVIEPLLEVWPDAVLHDGTPITDLSAAVADQKVRKVDTIAPGRRASVLLLFLVAAGALAIWWIGDWLF